MPNNPPTTNRSRVRRAALGALAVAAVGVLASGGQAEAGRRTNSELIADQAERAVEALSSWQTTRSPADYVRFVQGRDRTAALTGVDLEVDSGSLRRAWASTSLEKQQAILAAMSQLGVPYRYAASDPGVAFDCSGLTLWAYEQAGSVIPRVSRDQIAAAAEAPDGEPGDLVYWPGHIGIYLGADAYVHSPNSGNVVEAARLPDRSVSFGDAVETADPVAEPVATVPSPEPVAGQATALDAARSLVDRALPVSK